MHSEVVEKVAAEIEETWRVQVSINSDLHVMSFKEMASEEHFLIKHAADVPLLCKLRKNIHCDENLKLVKIDEAPRPDEEAWPKLRALLEEQNDVGDKQTEIVAMRSGQLRNKIREKADKKLLIKMLKEKKLAEKAVQLTWDRVFKLQDLLEAYKSTLINKKGKVFQSFF